MFSLLVVVVTVGACELVPPVKVQTPEICDDLVARRSALIAKREAMRVEMEHDVDLALHSVPGQSLDAAGLRDAEAYLQRVRERWRTEDARITQALSGSAAALRAHACRAD